MKKGVRKMEKIRNVAVASRVISSPIGALLIGASSEGLAEVSFKHDLGADMTREPNAILDACEAQLGEYFDGKRLSFDVPLDLRGTPFQLSVWRALLLIPCGQTWSYGQVARQIGREKAARAIGGANHNNPVAIIVPCHRVIGGDGKLVGYGGGIHIKQWLLEHEKKFAE